MLFQYDVSRPSPQELAGIYWSAFGDDVSGDARDFCNRIVLGAIDHLAEIDEHIRRRAEHWRISRMAIVDRNILRLAIYEFLYEPDTPKTVVINEALEIARRFSTFEATQFINGILDAIKRDIEGDQLVPIASTSATNAPSN